MKLNKIILVSILLLIFAIGAVSAADENITDTTDVLVVDDVDDSIEESAEDVLSADSAGEGEVEAAQGDFAELQSLVDNTASGKTLYLEKDYSFTRYIDEFAVRISNSIIIDGKGHTIDAARYSNIFIVDNMNVVLKNINFINSRSHYAVDGPECDSAVYSFYQDCKIINCSFKNCDGFEGGAIHAGDAYDCSFEVCNANEGARFGDYGKGGAIFNGNAYNCSFVKCSSPGGGAIYEGDAYDCSFVDCSSTGEGGAISEGNAYDCSFVKCSSDNGGAIGMGNAYDCSFVDCSSTGEGGAFFGGKAYDSTFINCSSYCGGAISNGGASNCSFVNCSASEGGAIDSGDVTYSYFEGCFAECGGAVCFGDVKDCLFINCSSSKDGGATAFSSVYDCLFINCSAKEHGAVVYKKDNASDSFCVNCHDAYDELTYPTAWSEDNYNEGNYVLKSDSPLIYGYVAANSIDSSKVIVVAKLASDATGNVKFTINGVTKKVKVANGKAQTYFYDLAGGTYPVDIQYDGDNNYPADSISTSIEIKQQNAINSVSADDVEYGHDAVIEINVNKDTSGNLYVAVNNITQEVKITGGTLNVSFSNLKIGAYDVTVSYPGSDKFPAQNMTTSFNVIKGTPIASGAVNPNPVGFGDDAIIIVNMSSSQINGNVWFTISDENKTKILTDKIHIENGTATRSIPDLGLGKYYLHLYYAGNTHYNSQIIKGTFEVVKKTPIASGEVNPNPVGFGDDAIIIVNMSSSQVNGNVWFTISDENRTKILTDKIHIENGTATRSIPGLGLGKYYLHIYYAGNVHYNAQIIKGTFEVVKKTPIESVNVSNWAPGEDVKIKVKVNNVNGNIWYTVSDENKTKILTDKIHIEDGWAIVSLPKSIKEGKYYLHIYYAGNVHYATQIIKTSFEVTKISPGLSVAKTTVDGKTVLTASIAEDAAGNVKFVVNGSTYKAIINKGTATITLPDMAPGTYILTSSYGGNYKYLAETKTRSITIK